MVPCHSNGDAPREGQPGSCGNSKECQRNVQMACKENRFADTPEKICV